MDAADLEISLRRQEDGGYLADALFRRPADQADTRLAAGVPLRFALGELRAELDPAAYGGLLSSMLFGPEQLRQALAQARAFALGADLPLRLRLWFPLDSELHALRWETLQDPASGAFLCRDERLLVSRYVDSQDLALVRLPPRSQLRALIVVAAPTDLADYQMAPIDVAGEVGRAQAALAGVEPTVLTGAPGARIGFARLVAALAAGYDIVYLVAHGTQGDDGSYLWLEGDDGRASHVRGDDVRRAVAQIARRPLLVVLAACQSAGDGQDDEAIKAIGPSLARAGVAAVVAMQGSVPARLVERLIPVFLRELLADGQVDRAMALARRSVDADWPWWMPALFMRVRDGRIWLPDQPLARPAGRRRWLPLALGIGASLVVAVGLLAWWWWLRPPPGPAPLVISIAGFAGCPAAGDSLYRNLAADLPAADLRRIGGAQPDSAGAGVDLVVWGACQAGDDRLELRLELLRPDPVAEAVEPEQLTLTTTSLDLTRASALLRAASRYLDADFASAAASFGDLATQVREQDERAALALMQGNSLLFAGDAEAAIDAYGSALESNAFKAAAQHNRGLAALNHALAVGRSSQPEGMANILAAALADLDAAAASEDPRIQARALANRAAAHYLVDLDFTAASDDCAGAIALSPTVSLGYLCRAAAAFWENDEQRDSCAPPIDAEAVGADLSRAEERSANDRDRAIVAFYRGMLAHLQAGCAGTPADKAAYAADAADQFARFAGLTTSTPPLTQIDQLLRSLVPSDYSAADQHFS